MTKKLRWQVFPGRNRFFCNGRIILAESLSLFYLTIFLIFTTCALFFVFDCPFIYIHVSPAIPIVAVVLFIFTMSCFFHTAFSDPGIIPRARPDEAAFCEQYIYENYENGANQQRVRMPPKTREIMINNQPVKTKYCHTCLMFRPPRASHCSVCDNCVDCFDHHCPWVGNCVGRRNYRYFYMFIISFSLLCIYVLACSLTHLILLSKESNFMSACTASPASVWVFLVCFFSGWSILGLAGFHTFLTAVNLTTNEDLRGTYSRGTGNKNPYSSSLFNNCITTLCTSTPISLIDPRGEILHQDLSHNQVTNQHKNQTRQNQVHPTHQPPPQLMVRNDILTSDV